MSQAVADLPENLESLRAIIAAQATELAEANRRLHTRDTLIEKLKAQLALLRRARFGASSEKVERAIEQHPSVSQVAVIGVSHERWGEMVKAIVILRQDCQVTEADIIAFCKTRIGSYKAPKEIEFVGTFPLSPQGKILKHELRKLYGSQAIVAGDAARLENMLGTRQAAAG